MGKMVVRVVDVVLPGLQEMKVMELLIREIMVVMEMAAAPAAAAAVLVVLESMQEVVLLELAGRGIQKVQLFIIGLLLALLLFPQTLRMVHQISLMLAAAVEGTATPMLLEELVVEVVVHRRGMG